MTAAPTAAPTSTITAAPTKEHTMYAASTIPAQTVAELVEARGGRFLRIGEYVDTTPPEYDDVSAYAMSLIDLAIEGRATGELSPQDFDEQFALALRTERVPVIETGLASGLSDADQQAIEEMMEESRPKVYVPPVNGLTEVDELALAAARRHDLAKEYEAMLAQQEQDDDLEEIAQLDFSGLTPLVSEFDFSDLCTYTMEAAA